MENNWVLLAEIIAAGMILIYLFFRKGRFTDPRPDKIQRVEMKLLGELRPSEVTVAAGRTVHLLIHRYDADPAEELFEIEALELYELLPAGHTTVVKFTPTHKGSFPMVLAGEREAGRLIVE